MREGRPAVSFAHTVVLDETHSSSLGSSLRRSWTFRPAGATSRADSAGEHPSLLCCVLQKAGWRFRDVRSQVGLHAVVKGRPVRVRFSLPYHVGRSNRCHGLEQATQRRGWNSRAERRGGQLAFSRFSAASRSRNCSPILSSTGRRHGSRVRLLSSLRNCSTSLSSAGGNRRSSGGLLAGRASRLRLVVIRWRSDMSISASASSVSVSGSGEPLRLL